MRWHGRWAVESSADLRLRGSELALAALAALTTPARDVGLHALLELGRLSGLSTVDAALGPAMKGLPGHEHRRVARLAVAEQGDFDAEG